jgi:hypothetical protein
VSDEPRFPIGPEYRPAIVAGVILGVVAALVVWYLERFETKRVVAEAENLLKRHAAFDDYLRERGAGDA